MSAHPRRAAARRRALADRFVAWLMAHAVWVVLAALALSVPALARTAGLYLHLRSDLEALLPPDAPSVRALQELRTRTGGLSYLGVVVDAGDPPLTPDAERLLDDLAARVRAYPPSLGVQKVSTGLQPERAFFEQHAALYLDLTELESLRDRVFAWRDWQVARAMGALLDDTDRPPPLALDTTLRRHADRLGLERLPGGRFVSPDGRYAVLLIGTGRSESGTSVGGAILRRVRQDLADLRATGAYAPGLRVGFAGDIAARVEELDALVVDLTISSLVVLAAVALVIVLHYRWWPALVVLGVPLLLGTALSFALCTLPPLALRELNSNTAFLGAIIVGNGVNTGIILLARHQEERRRGASPPVGLATAICTTARATGTASLAAALAYGSLLVTRFRGFNQFGWIGALGMLLCWACTMLLVPPLLALLDRGPGIAGTRRGAAALPGIARVLAAVERLVRARPRHILVVAAVLTALSAVAFVTMGEGWIETDYGKLRVRSTWTSGEAYWGGKLDLVIGRYLTPAVMLTDDADETLRLGAEVRRAVAGPLARDIEGVVTFQDVLPDHQPEKLAILREIAAALTPRLRAAIPEPERSDVERLLSPEALRPITPLDLPASVVDGMRENDGRIDRAVLVYPRPSPRAWQAPTLRAITTTLRDAAARAARPYQAPARVAGALMLSYDLLQTIGRDGPLATGVAFLLVLALIALAFGPTRTTALVAGSLVAAVLWVIGSMRLTGIKLNFANFVVFPITFGIGADYAVNVVGRYRADGEHDVLRAIRATGSAVVLASLTTVIGYSSLVLARNQALFLFGVVAVLGELASLTTSLVALPAALRALRADHLTPAPRPRDPAAVNGAPPRDPKILFRPPPPE